MTDGNSPWTSLQEIGAGQYGFATAIVCARFSLQCVIYMGAQDIERQALNVFRMRLLRVKAEGLREMSCVSGSCSKIHHEDFGDENDENEDEGEEKLSQTVSSSSSALVIDNRREKSLGLLTKNFVKLFLITNVETASLDEAARLLLGDMNDASYMITKVRRLYDIANVLSSMNIIEKVHVEARKPAFRWLGSRGDKPKMDTGVTIAKAPAAKLLNKRAFGTEITNYDAKKSRICKH